MSQTGRQHIILIQNDSQLVRTRKAILESQGYSVDVVEDPDHARTLCREFKCDLVILDSDQGHESALDLCDEMKKLNPKLNVAVMNRYNVHLRSDCFDEVIRQEEGPEGFVAKIKSLIPPPAPSPSA